MTTISPYCFPGIRPSDRPGISWEFIEQIVAEEFNISRKLLMVKTRQHSTLVPRQIASYLIKKYYKASCTQIARHYKLDHSTVLHGFKRVEEMFFDANLKIRLANIINNLTNVN